MASHAGYLHGISENWLMLYVEIQFVINGKHDDKQVLW